MFPHIPIEWVNFRLASYIRSILLCSNCISALFELYNIFFPFLGSGSDRGQSPVEWVHISVRPSVHPPSTVWPSIIPSVRLSIRPLCWLDLRPGWMAQRGGHTYVQTNEQTENLPILQDFVPYRSRCPASEPHENQGESRAGQGNR